jgi:hypothetical protein
VSGFSPLRFFFTNNLHLLLSTGKRRSFNSPDSFCLVLLAASTPPGLHAASTPLASLSVSSIYFTYLLFLLLTICPCSFMSVSQPCALRRHQLSTRRVHAPAPLHHSSHLPPLRVALTPPAFVSSNFSFVFFANNFSFLLCPIPRPCTPLPTASTPSVPVPPPRYTLRRHPELCVLYRCGDALGPCFAAPLPR